MNKNAQTGAMVLVLLAVMVITLFVSIEAPVIDRTTLQTANPTPTQGSVLSLTDEPTEVINPVQETHAEDFVDTMIFDSTGDRIVFTTDGLYPNSRAVFGLPFNNEDGVLAVASSVVSGVPEGIAEIDRVRAANNRIIFIGTADGSDGPEVSPEDRDSELFSVDLAGNGMITLTHGIYNPYYFDARIGSSQVVFADGSMVFAVNATTGVTVSLGSYGFIYGVVESSDGSIIAVTHQDTEMGESKISLVNSDGSNPRLLYQFVANGREQVPSSVVIADDGYVYAALSAKRSSAPLAFDVELYRGRVDQTGMVPITSVSGITTDSMRLLALQPHPNWHDLMFLHGGSLWSLDVDTMTITKVSDPSDRPEYVAFSTGPGNRYWVAYVVTQATIYDPSKVTASGSEHGESTPIRIKALQ